MKSLVGLSTAVGLGAALAYLLARGGDNQFRVHEPDGARAFAHVS